jgi:hypothetical protein
MKKIILTALILLVLIVGVSFAFSRTIPPEQTQNETVPTLAPTVAAIPDVPYEAQLEGSVVCLPHKDTSGPQTLECAFGLQTAENEYYALDANGQNPPPFNTGQRIRATGIITPAEMLSSDHWQKYNMKGIFSLRSEVEVL